MQTDPIGYGDGMNMYAYVGNDPVNMADPDGGVARAIVSAFKIAKRTVEHRGNVFKAVREEALDIADTAVTIFDSDASGTEKAAAVVSVFIGVNVGGRKTLNVTEGVPNKTVGRWMSPDELSEMRRTGRVQEGGGGQTRVADPANPNTYRNPPEGDVYVEFDVPANRVLPHSQGTGRIPGPNSPDARVPGRNPADFEMPAACNIRVGEGC